MDGLSKPSINLQTVLKKIIRKCKFLDGFDQTVYKLNKPYGIIDIKKKNSDENRMD
jgi:hypothetical protein